MPLIALIVLSVAYYEAFVLKAADSATPAEDFTTRISIELVYKNQTGGLQVTYIVPQKGIGVLGGFWQNHAYDADGINGHYPVYGQFNTNGTLQFFIIHVSSRVVRSYTLGDFFAVWGQPLGQSNTLGYTTPPASSQTQFPSNWFWDMCIIPPRGSLTTGHWGSEVLVSSLSIILVYSDQGCG